MKKNTLVLTTFTLLFTQHIFAESLWPIMETKRCAPVVTLSLGPAVTGGIDSQTFFLQSDIVKSYQVNRKPRVFGQGELFAGWQIPMSLNLLAHIGVALATGIEAPLAGDIWEDADPDFDNYTYKFKVNHGHLALKGKLLTDVNTTVQPYLSASIGAGINQSKNFSINPKIFEEIPHPYFTTGTTGGLAYTLGLGIQTAYTANWQAGIGYEFSDWGNLHLGKAPGQTVNTGLGGNHLYTHELQFSFTYVFNSRAARS